MRFFYQAPLKKKLIWIISVTSLFVLGCSIGGFSIYDRISYKNDLVSEQRVLATIIADRSSAAVAFSDRNNAQSNLEALRAHKAVSSACIYQKHSLFAEYLGSAGQTRCPTAAPDFSDYRFNNNYLETIAPITVNDKVLGQLYIISTLTALEERTASISMISLLLLLVIGSGGLFIASRLISIATKSLSKLEATARAIADRRDYSVRSDKVFDDDIGLLIDTFNGMLNTIEQQNNALKDSEETLKSIINDAPDLMQIVDRQGEIIFVNREQSYPRLQSNLFDTLSGEQLQNAQRALAKVFQEGSTAEFETRDTASGLWYAHHLGPLRENGEIRSALVMKRDISALKLAHEKLSRIAFYDPLTGLPNRRHFKDQLAEKLRQIDSSSSRVALLFMDLDDFKPINDTLGHKAGDQLLVSVANRLSNCIRSSDVVSRLGGDEFTIMLAGIKDHEVEQIAQKIVQSMQAPVYLDRQSIEISLSIGIALAPLHGRNTKELMHAADTAMYRAKAQGKNAYMIFDPSMADDDQSQQKIEQEIRTALQEDQFQVYYQPQVDMQSSRVVGLEVLLRWNHPERGLLQPHSFIQHIENHGLMMEMTRWSLRTACREIRHLGSENQQLNSIRLALNLSSSQFQDPDLVNFIEDILTETQFPAHRLELDIPETSLVASFERSIETMNAMRKLGVSLSIDDFGTSHAPLNFLRKLPINFLKIDRSFISEIPYNTEHRELTLAILAMAQHLNLGVLAEGVESEMQFGFLKEHLCTCAQGYYVSHPVPAAELSRIEGLRQTTSKPPLPIKLIKT